MKYTNDVVLIWIDETDKEIEASLKLIKAEEVPLEELSSISITDIDRIIKVCFLLVRLIFLDIQYHSRGKRLRKWSFRNRL
jgi:hypothetical protein